MTATPTRDPSCSPSLHRREGAATARRRRVAGRGLYRGQQHRRLMRGVDELRERGGIDVDLRIVSAGHGARQRRRALAALRARPSRAWPPTQARAERRRARHPADVGACSASRRPGHRAARRRLPRRLGSATSVGLGGPDPRLLRSRARRRSDPPIACVRRRAARPRTRGAFAAAVGLKGEVGGRLLALIADGPDRRSTSLRIDRSTMLDLRSPTATSRRTRCSELMRFYFPDSQDQIDPSFDFETEERSPFRIRQRDDLYAHEVLDPAPYDGHARLEGDRRRRRRRRRPLQRPAAPAALPRRRPRVLPPRRGAGTAHRRRSATAGRSATSAKPTPPYTVDEVIDFYEGCGFDAGSRVDHVILGFELHAPLERRPAAAEWPQRQAADARTRRGVPRAAPRAAAARSSRSGSPRDGARSPTPSRSRQLQHIGLRAHRARRPGCRRRRHEILAVLEAVDARPRPRHRSCTCSASRVEHDPCVSRRFGVTSFDSTSPFRQAFKDDRDNYYDRGPHLRRAAGPAGRRQRQAAARGSAPARSTAAGAAARAATRSTHARAPSTAATRRSRRRSCALREYEELHDGRTDRSAAYREVLAARAVEGLRLRGLPRRRDPGDHLPRDRAQQAPRLPQPARLRATPRREQLRRDAPGRPWRGMTD